ncbi:MAG TPA: transglycosylase SLT domain-containing protein [Polyangiaceae bacterium]|nr:transglycosylase SLT domain-containing protein [Polyangiaceae bacterium]
MLCVLGAPGACARTSLEGTEPGEAKVTRKAPEGEGRPGTAEPAVGDATAAEPLEWIELVRAKQWAEAAEAIDALDEPERDRPDVRYVRARVAMELADHAGAATLLEGLEQQLPMFSSEIAEQRARCELEVGPYDRAAAYFIREGSPRALLQAAAALRRAGELARARQLTDRVLASLRKLRSRSERERLEIEARALRAELAEQQGHKRQAIADLRWLSIAAPTSPQAAGVDERLEKMAAPPLTGKQRLERAVHMAKQGLVEQTERELERIELGAQIAKAQILRTRAWALYSSRRDYALASELLEKAVSLGSPEPVRDLFYAARARSRANEDERAAGMYADLARRFPKSGYAEQARFLGARLLYIGGEWDEAAVAYTEYLRRHGKRGRFAEEAEYERAVSWLAGGAHDEARKAFDGFVARERDVRRRATLRQLAGVAALGQKDTDAAAERFEAVIREAPLSFAALMSASRLRQLERSVPPLLELGDAGPPGPPLEVELPPKVEKLIALGLDGDAEREITGHEGALRARYGARASEALCEAYGQVAGAERRYRVAQSAVTAAELNATPLPGRRWAWECVYPRPYPRVIETVQAAWNVPAELLYAVIRQESGFRETVVSPADAVGLMQMIPPTAIRVASELEVDYHPDLLRSPGYNLNFGAYYLRKMLDTFGGSVPLALAAYNAGPIALSRWLEGGERLPLDLFVARIPYDETRNYVNRVIGNYARYTYLHGGPPAVPSLPLDLPQGHRAPPDAY